jgi:hypothetical protein
MISFELAKKLKEAGFPGSDSWNKFRDKMVGVEDDNSVPSLSELIEACGPENKFGKFNLNYGFENKWWASYGYVNEDTDEADGWVAQRIEAGSTPDEAVSNLWLVIHGNN